MLTWAACFFILTLAAALVGFTDAVPALAAAGSIAFIVFTAMFLVSCLIYVFKSAHTRRRN